MLASNYGMAYFRKWFVIASTMSHLRKDFYSDFKIPTCTKEYREQYVLKLKKAFEKKAKGYDKMQIAISEITGMLML